MVERSNKAERRPEEQSDKVERCRENLWNEILQLKGSQRRKQTKEQNKNERAGKLGWFMSKT